MFSSKTYHIISHTGLIITQQFALTTTMSAETPGVPLMLYSSPILSENRTGTYIYIYGFITVEAFLENFYLQKYLRILYACFLRIFHIHNSIVHILMDELCAIC
jgi:hypothetical protein